MKTIAEQKKEWISQALNSGQCVISQCSKCGSSDSGFFCVMDGTFRCLKCMADDIFWHEPERKLDVEDFARV